MNFQRDPLLSKIPITIITGFLGSGKTTLISQLVRHPSMNRVAVVINEVGEIGIDHDLVASSTENITLLSNGCICCSVRTDMQETLRDLFAKRNVGEVFDFDRIIIETTGLADPAPVLQTLVSDTLLEAQFRFDGLVTLVDALNLESQLDLQSEVVKQIAIADKILLSKTDLVDESQVLHIKILIQSLNAQAPIIPVVQGKIDPLQLMNLGLSSTKSQEKILQFLGESSSAEKYLGNFVSAHSSKIKTHAITFSGEFTWNAFSSALDLLSNLRGPDLLRMKGIVNVENQAVVIQGVQHIFSPPVYLKDWPSPNKDTRLVFITRSIEASMIQNLFETVRALQN
jgi:G3E family GTPase